MQINHSSNYAQIQSEPNFGKIFYPLFALLLNLFVEFSIISAIINFSSKLPIILGLLF